MAINHEVDRDVEFRDLLTGMGRAARESMFLQAVRLFTKKRKFLVNHGGRKKGNNYLTPDRVREIKGMLARNLSCGQIAKIFNIHKERVRNIKRGVTWKNIT